MTTSELKHHAKLQKQAENYRAAAAVGRQYGHGVKNMEFPKKSITVGSGNF